MSTPLCPDCGQPMREYAHGPTLRKHPLRYICPFAEAERWHNKEGHLKWRLHSKHDPKKGGLGIRIWKPEELEGQG